MTDLKAKMYQVRFQLGSAPDPARGAYSAPPGPPAGFGEPLRGRGGAGLGNRRERGGDGEGEGSGGEGKGGPLSYC